MTEQKFKKLVEETLHVLEGYEVDKNGNKKMHIVGIEKLYKQLNLPVVSQQRELLNSFIEWATENRVVEQQNTNKEIVDNYLKTIL